MTVKFSVKVSTPIMNVTLEIRNQRCPFIFMLRPPFEICIFFKVQIFLGLM